MSLLTAPQVPDIAEVLSAALRKIATSNNETDNTEVPEAAERPPQEERKRKKRRQKDPQYGPVIGAALRFQRQVRWRARHRPDIVEAMASHVAVTILPGDRAADFAAYVGARVVNNVEIPRVPIVNIRFPRIVVEYRFPERNAPHSGIAVVGYKVGVDRSGCVRYGGAANCEFVKNLAIKPHARAGGAAIDTEREPVVYDTAMELDWALECAAQGRIPTVGEFNLPPVLFGFPTNYTVRVEETSAMIEHTLSSFTENTPVLRCFLSPGGIVLSINELPGALRLVSVEVDGNLKQVRIPRWAIIPDCVKPGAAVPAGTALADLPRFASPTMTGLKDAYNVNGLEWVQRRVLEEVSEMVTVEEKVFNKDVKAWAREPRTLEFVPARFVPGQVARSIGKYLDLRNWIGRELPAWADPEHARATVDPLSAKIQVVRLSYPPSKRHGLTRHSEDKLSSSDFAGLKPAFEWLAADRDGPG